MARALICCNTRLTWANAILYNKLTAPVTYLVCSYQTAVIRFYHVELRCRLRALMPSTLDSDYRILTVLSKHHSSDWG